MRRTWNGTCVEEQSTEPLVSVQPAGRDVRLDSAVLDGRDVEGLLEDPIGGGEGRLDVGDGRTLDVSSTVPSGVEDPDAVGLVVDQRRVLGQRLPRVEHGGEDLVGHLDPAAGLLGELDGVGRHRGDAVADVTDLVVEAHLIPRIRVRPALAGRRVLHPRRVREVQDGSDAGNRARLGVVDRDDPRVGVGAAQHLCVQQPARLDVAGEGGVALDEPDRVHLPLGLADHGRGGHVG